MPWKLRASEAEVVVIVVTHRPPTRAGVGQDCGEILTTDFIARSIIIGGCLNTFSSGL